MQHMLADRALSRACSAHPSRAGTVRVLMRALLVILIAVLCAPATFAQVPSTPTAFKATIGDTQLSLSWTVSSGATSYNLYRSSTSGGEGTTPYVTGITSTSYTDTGLTDGTTYYYTVDAVNASGTSAQSSEVYGTPNPPVTFSGEQAWDDGANFFYKVNYSGTYPNFQLFLDTDSSSATGYTINGIGADYMIQNGWVYKSTANGSSWSWTHVGSATLTFPTSGTLQFECSLATIGAPASAKVDFRELTSNWIGANDPTLVTFTGSQTLVTPTNLKATWGDTQLSLSWTGSAWATSYNLYRSTTKGGEGTTPYQTGVTSTSYTDTGLTDGTAYYYTVAAVNSTGTSSQSSEAEATPNPPTSFSGEKAWDDGTNFYYQVTYSGVYLHSIVLLDTDNNAATGYTTRGIGADYMIEDTQLYKSTANGSSWSWTAVGSATKTFPSSGVVQLSCSLSGIGAPSTAKVAYTEDDANWVGTNDPTLVTYVASNVPPTVATAASASPNPVSGTTTNLSVLGAYPGGESQLTYTWSVSSAPTGAPAVTFSANGTNAAKNTTATFGQAGAYTLTATITNPYNLTATSSVSVTVTQTATSIAVSPATASLSLQGTQQFSAIESDQFQQTMATQPSFTWSIDQGAAGGTVSTAGLYTAPTTPGTYTVRAADGSISGTATVTVSDAPPTLVTPAAASPNPVTGTTTSLSVLGADDGGESSLTYTWSATGPAPVSFSVNGTNAAKNATATFTQTGNYTLTATIADTAGLTVTSSVTVTVNQTATSIAVTPATITLGVQGTQQFSAVENDQFGQPVPTQPASFTWTVVQGSAGGTISTTGFYTAPTSTGTYTVRAASGQISGTATVKVVLPAPFGLRVSSSSGYLSLLWNAVSGATSYNVYRSTSPGGEGSVPFKSGVTGSSYYDSSVTNGTTYYYTVTAVNGSGEGLQSNEASGTAGSTALTGPILKAVAGNAQVALTWSSISSATSYNLYRGSALYKFGLTSTTYTDTAVTNGTNYSYYVTAVGVSGEGRPSNTVNATPGSTALPAPTGVRAQLPLYGGTGITVYWNAVTNATGYNVYRSTTPGGEGSVPYAVVGNTTSYSDSSVTTGTTYYYKVTAVNSTGEGAFSAEVSATAGSTILAAPANLKAITGNAQVTLNWGAVTGATSYNLYRGSSVFVQNITSSTYTDTAVTNGTNYSYYVTAVNVNGEGHSSNTVNATPGSTALPAPTGVRVVAGSSTQTVYWNSVTNATSYNVYRSTTPGGEGAVPYALAGNSTSYVDNSVSNGTTYYYRVTAVNNTGEGALSAEASGTPGSARLAAPSSLKALAGNGQVTLYWGAVSGATSYNLYRGGSVFAQNITSATYVDTAVTNGTNYYYTVSAVNLNGESPTSNTAYATPGSTALPAPTGMHADWQTTYGPATLSVGWNTVTNATSYNVYRSTTPGGEGLVPYAVGVTSTSYSDPNYVNGTMYYYTTTAVNSTGEGAMSSEVSVLVGSTQLAAPAHILARPGNAQATVIWTATPNATSYNVYRSGPSGTFVITNVTSTSFVDTGLVNGTSYTYRVAGVCVNGEGVTTGYMGPPAYAVPGTVIAAGPAVSVVNSCGVNLSWTAVNGAMSYNLYRSTTPGGEGGVPYAWNIGSTSYTDAGATYTSGASTYYYTLTVVNTSGEGPQGPESSDTLQSVFTLTPVPATVNVTRGTTGNSVIQINTNCSNGDTVTLSVTSGLTSGLTAWVTPWPESVTYGAVSVRTNLNAGMKDATLYICPDSTVPPGTYPITVTGVGSSGASSVTVNVNVQ